MNCKKEAGFLYVMEFSPDYHIFECVCCSPSKRYVFFGKLDNLYFYDYFENFIVYNN